MKKIKYYIKDRGGNTVGRDLEADDVIEFLDSWNDDGTLTVLRNDDGRSWTGEHFRLIFGERDK